MSSPSRGRNLLAAVIALKMNFVARETLDDAMKAWFDDPTLPFDQILVERGHINAATQVLLRQLVDHNLAMHGGNAEESIDSLSSGIHGLEDFGILPTDANQTITHDADAASAVGASSRPGAAHSRYRTGQMIGGGGLGVVFIADDAELNRKVAVKEIRPEHADNSDCRDRFTLEAEITGRLEHPGIVPVHGYGCYSNGRPYYAMKLIEGTTLRDAIDAYQRRGTSEADNVGERSLAFRNLLTRFVAVCHAAAYAHDRGVVHRDIKPTNIMLGKFGETLLLDWGLAKSIGRTKTGQPDATIGAEPTLRPGSGSAVMTADGRAIGTPAYMSPQQAAGSHDDHAGNDIYSLGATLYHILVGKPPFEGDAESVLEAVQQGPFPAPVTANSDVPPALNAICLKATAHRIPDRYASALDLAADIEHWLADEPVSAWPEPFGTRSWRWVKRHRTAVTAAAVLLATAAVGLGVSTALIWREEKKTKLALETAEENLVLARTMSNQLMGFERESPSDSQSLALYKGQYFEESLAAVKESLARQPNEPTRREVAAWLFWHVANAQRVGAKFDRADDHYRSAIELLESLITDFPDRIDYREHLAAALCDFGKCLNRMPQRQRDATSAFVKAKDIARQLRKANPDSIAYARLLAVALSELSVQHLESLELENCAAVCRESVALLENMGNERKLPNPIDQFVLGITLNRLAVTLREQKLFEEATQVHSRAIDSLRQQYARPVDDTFGNALVRALNESAKTAISQPGNEETALKMYSEALEIVEALVQRQPLNASYRILLASVLSGRATVNSGLANKSVQANADFDRAIGELKALVTQGPQVASFHSQLGRTYLAAGKSALKQGQAKSAEKLANLAKQCLTEAIRIAPSNQLYQRAQAEAELLLQSSQRLPP